jgi:drug/metabolite transporter (DMT)-like permease
MKNKGVYFALLTSLVSGISVFFNKFATAEFKDPYVFTALKNVGVAFLFLGIIAIPKFWKELKSLGKKDWANLIIIAVVGGSIPFLLFFKGLTMTSAVNAAFIHKTLFIWVGILAVFFLKEKFGRLQWLAFALLFGGNLLLGGLKSWRIGTGEVMIFGATLLWSIEYIFAKRALKKISSELVAWGRMFLGAIILVGFIIVGGRGAGLLLTAHQISWLVISNVLLFGYVVFWYKALKYENASVVTAYLVPASLITTILNSIFVSRQFSLQAAGAGILFLTALALLYLGRPKTAYELTVAKKTI